MTILALAFQPNLLGVLSQFSQFDATVRKYIGQATTRSAARLHLGMLENTDRLFVNPTGQLASTINEVIVTEYLAHINVESPYAWRRERGFSGMTDSLGRFYPHDPGVYYAQTTIEEEDVLQDVAVEYIHAIYSAWNELVGSLPGGTSVAVGVM